MDSGGKRWSLLGFEWENIDSTTISLGNPREDMDFTVKRCDCTGHKYDVTRETSEIRTNSAAWT